MICMKLGNLDPQEVGSLGEKLAANYLINQGFRLLELNCRNKMGEIDIIMRDDKRVLCFVEVKTVRDTGFDPQELINNRKIKRLHKTINSYLQQHNLCEEVWHLDAVVVYLDKKKGEACCEYYEHIS